jgi:predicted DNA-binding transcriptional regulator AlpA
MEELHMIDWSDRRLLTEREAARFLGMTVSFLRARRIRGGGPPFIRVGSRTVRYDVRDLEGWIEAQRRQSTSES